ncbi:MAG: hypothetical protein H0X65_02950 [Gemmatimonadetes bacterium]|jgi:hypothetical protein|nr:hypothetical protein [Gemmatimonadota bacterium]
MEQNPHLTEREYREKAELEQRFAALEQEAQNREHTADREAEKQISYSDSRARSR